MLGLALAIVIFHIVYRSIMLKQENEKQLASISAAVEAEERHKAKIAGDLHDEALNALTMLKQELEIQNVQNEKINTILNETITTVRRIALDLVPMTLIRQGLIKSLESLAIQITTQRERVVEFRNELNFDNRLKFSQQAEVNIYRVCLEIIRNLVKHCDFTYLVISIEPTSNSLIIDFTHNGKGVSNHEIELSRKKTTGLGLASIDARLLILNATINYAQNSEGDFWTVVLTIPFKNER